MIFTIFPEFFYEKMGWKYGITSETTITEISSETTIPGISSETTLPASIQVRLPVWYGFWLPVGSGFWLLASGPGWLPASCFRELGLRRFWFQ